MGTLDIGERLWKPPENVREKGRNGFRNFWIATDAPDGTHFRQTAGINPVRKAANGRRPAVAIFLTPAGDRHRLPWLDEVDLSNGFIRYFGDNKPALRRPPEQAPGNRVLLEEMDLAASSELGQRVRAAPLLFFRNLGNPDGVAITEFLGYGLIREAHRLTQFYKGETFSNFAFDCVLLRGTVGTDGRESVDIAWIDERRSSADDAECLPLAPKAWQLWSRHGRSALDRRDVRRFVMPHTSGPRDQLPSRESDLGKTLAVIYDHYANSKHSFEALAALVTKQVIAGPGLDYQSGWVTPKGGDGGVDFVQRLDIGSGFSSARLIVLGQAKCRSPWTSGSGVSGEDLARVVARLRRGWIGAYVTTSFFTEAAQRELNLDQYPIVLIPGERLAQVASELQAAGGHSSMKDFLGWVDHQYVMMVARSRARAEEMALELPGNAPAAENGTAVHGST
jgi:hypothetical protein